MQEIWKNVTEQEFSNLYQVSNMGRVRSLDRIRPDGSFYKGRVLKPRLTGSRYYYVTLSHGTNYQKRRYIHRLVALAFIENPMNKPQVSHKDENCLNNCASNLEWASAKENSNMPLHKERQKIIQKAVTSHKGKEVVCENQQFVSITMCAVYYGIKPNLMSRWLTGVRKMPLNFVKKGLKYASQTN